METISHQIQTSHIYNFEVKGMTCSSCENTLEKRALTLKGVTTAKANTKTGSLEIISNRPINFAEVTQAFSDLSKYQIFEAKKTLEPQKANAPKDEKNLFQTYKPLITVFSFVLLVSLSYQVGMGEFHGHLFMNHLMAGFFIGLSFFKFLDLKSFTEAFSNYDPVAQHFVSYGYIYAFIEVMLGLLFVAGKFLAFANIATIVVLSLTTFGVIKHLRSNSKFQCACLGAGFNLPLSKVTVTENLVMIGMALYGLL
jgi:cation transport ATPase